MSDNDLSCDDDLYDSVDERAKRAKISKTLSKRKDSLHCQIEKYLMKCNRTSAILVLHTGLSHKPTVLFGGPAIVALGQESKALEGFLKGIMAQDTRCTQLLEDFHAHTDAHQTQEPHDGFFEWAEKERLILPDQVPKLRAALATYMADEGKQIEKKGKRASCPSSKERQNAKAQLLSHVGNLHAGGNGNGVPANIVSMEALVPSTMHAQREDSRAQTVVVMDANMEGGPSIVMEDPTIQAPMHKTVPGLTEQMDDALRELRFDINQTMPNVRRRLGTLQDKLLLGR